MRKAPIITPKAIAPYRVPVNHRISLMGYLRYGRRQVCDSKANEQGWQTMCRTKSATYHCDDSGVVLLTHRKSSGANTGREADLALNGETAVARRLFIFQRPWFIIQLLGGVPQGHRTR